MSGNMSFDETVAGFMRVTGKTRADAERDVRRSLGLTEPTKTPEEIERDESILEDREQTECVKMLRAYGCKVYVTSQKRRAKVSPGIPDLIVSKRSLGVFFFWETKRQVGGALSAEQVEFAEDCRAFWKRTHYPIHGTGDRYELAKLLVQMQLAVFDGDGVNGISPKAPP